VPLPVPLVPELIVIQLAVLTAVQVHAVPFGVTPTLPVPPAAPEDAVKLESE